MRCVAFVQSEASEAGIEYLTLANVREVASFRTRSYGDGQHLPMAYFISKFPDESAGSLDVARQSGNVANTSTIASIEYAVAHIGTPVIVVLGHQACGAVTAAIAGGDNGYNLNHLLAHIEPAKAASEDSSVNGVVKTNARMTAQELQDRSAIIRGAVDGGKLKIVPAYYSLDDGSVSFD